MERALSHSHEQSGKLALSMGRTQQTIVVYSLLFRSVVKLVASHGKMIRSAEGGSQEARAS